MSAKKRSPDAESGSELEGRDELEPDEAEASRSSDAETPDSVAEGDVVGATDADEAAGSEVDDLTGEVEALTSELEELRDRHLRLAAEFDNFRKRTVRERSQQADRARAELVKELLESLDDLSRVSQEGAATEDSTALLQGIELVERKLRRTLERNGLRAIEAVGEPFDPELHEALTTLPTDDPDEDGVVAQELAKGYLFNDLLLRPALVEVKKYSDAGSGAGGDEAAGEDDS